MELLRDSIPMVSLAVSAAALFARAMSACVRPGFTRLATLLPVGVFFAAVPFAFSSAVTRCSAALILAWLGTFKVALLAAGHGPLHPGLPGLIFVFLAALPIKLRGGRHRAAVASRSGAGSVSLVSCAFKVTVVAAIIHFYHFVDRLHRYMLYMLNGINIWFSMELLFTCITAAGRALGMEAEPQFVRPFLASSLRDFWGRRWNLSVSAVLREAVYNPLRARAGKEAGILGTFLVSGLMHEALVYYFTLQSPTGEMAAFFLLHGTCRVAEEWSARWWAARGWPPLPRPIATVLVDVFTTCTSFWLIFPSVFRR